MAAAAANSCTQWQHRLSESPSSLQLVQRAVTEEFMYEARLNRYTLRVLSICQNIQEMYMQAHTVLWHAVDKACHKSSKAFVFRKANSSTGASFIFNAQFISVQVFAAQHID